MNKKGFTLIEVIIALTLLVIIIPAFSTSLVSSLRNEEAINDQHQYRKVSNSIIENLKSDKYRKKLGNSNIIWEENNSYFIDYKINFSNNSKDDSDIIIQVNDSSGVENLYLVKIIWQNNNYSIETLITGD